jgi:hypothetical protein
MQRIRLILAALLAFSGPLAASILFEPATGSCLVVPQADCENVLFQVDASGDPLLGVTNQTSTIVEFSSTNGILEGEASGQSRVTAQSDPFTNLTITVPDMLFAEVLFNINWARPTGPNPPEVEATISALDADGLVFTSAAFVLSNGQNFWRIYAIDDQTIASVTLNTTGGIADVRQVRLGGFVEGGGGGGGGVIPEPSTYLLLGTGLIALAYGARRCGRARRSPHRSIIVSLTSGSR